MSRSSSAMAMRNEDVMVSILTESLVRTKSTGRGFAVKLDFQWIGAGLERVLENVAKNAFQCETIDARGAHWSTADEPHAAVAPHGSEMRPRLARNRLDRLRTTIEHDRPGIFAHL